jgi:hypothetical protein
MTISLSICHRSINVKNQGTQLCHLIYFPGVLEVRLPINEVRTDKSLQMVTVENAIALREELSADRPSGHRSSVISHRKLWDAMLESQQLELRKRDRPLWTESESVALLQSRSLSRMVKPVNYPYIRGS